MRGRSEQSKISKQPTVNDQRTAFVALEDNKSRLQNKLSRIAGAEIYKRQ
jgi:hypothetical protein